MVLLLCLLFSLQAWSQSEEETRQRLVQLQQRMQQLDRELRSERARYSSLQNQLRDAEVTLGELSRNITANQKQLLESRDQLDELQAQRTTLEQARDAQRERVTLELRRAYQTGREGQLKVLLNQEQPDTLARAMTYYQYTYRARHATIEEYRNTLARIAGISEDISAVTADLEALSGQLEKQRQRTLKAQKNRQGALAKLDRSIAEKGDELKELTRDRQELERLLEVIEEAVVALRVPEDYKPFKAARGAMPWPLAGRHSNRFGRQRNEGGMRWQGVTIPAREGATVKAIHHGRVVFADWFRGSGLLLIIDHGDGYMSLYAHNQSLLREVGEWVTAGTPISTAGNSGGQQASALYFEIRHQGKPVNPTGWCSG